MRKREINREGNRDGGEREFIAPRACVFLIFKECEILDDKESGEWRPI